MNTLADVIKEAKWYTTNGGYREKATGAAQYLTDTLENFGTNPGSANWTYFGQLCGVNPGAWCAMFISNAVYKACGKDKAAAKKAMWGVWPYTACNQLWEAADDEHKFWGWYSRWKRGRGDRTDYTPCFGDVIIFTDNGTSRNHTGLVYAVDNTYVYTVEGNSSNMARLRSYDLKSSYIYGYVKLNLPKGDVDPATKEQYGPLCYGKQHELSKGNAGPEVKCWQGILNAYECTDDGGNALGCDGDFGKATKQATVRFQKKAFPNDAKEWDGVVGNKTWAAAFGD